MISGQELMISYGMGAGNGNVTYFEAVNDDKV